MSVGRHSLMLTSIALLVLAVVPHYKHAAKSRPDGEERRESLDPELLNALPIGCTQEAAICYLLENGGGRLELLYGALQQPNSRAQEYDDARILKVGDTRQRTLKDGKLYLYFREGFLVAKCMVPEAEISGPLRIFQREIAPGLQHPPSYPGLIERVHWGPARVPSAGRVRKKDGRLVVEEETAAAASWPKVRCGILLDDLPKFGLENGYNVLVLYQNVGEIPLVDDMILFGFPIGPVVMVTGRIPDSTKSEGTPHPLRLYGTAVTEVPVHAPLEKTANFRVARFRLGPGEAMFVWFRVQQLLTYDSVHARVEGLWGVNRDEIRDWSAKSAEVPIAHGNRNSHRQDDLVP